jgi:hypothetical protein
MLILLEFDKSLPQKVGSQTKRQALKRQEQVLRMAIEIQPFDLRVASAVFLAQVSPGHWDVSPGMTIFVKECQDKIAAGSSLIKR